MTTTTVIEDHDPRAMYCQGTGDCQCGGCQLVREYVRKHNPEW